jgi:hypothetical protein
MEVTVGAGCTNIALASAFGMWVGDGQRGRRFRRHFLPLVPSNAELVTIAPRKERH